MVDPHHRERGKNHARNLDRSLHPSLSHSATRISGVPPIDPRRSMAHGSNPRTRGTIVLCWVYFFFCAWGCSDFGSKRGTFDVDLTRLSVLGSKKKPSLSHREIPPTPPIPPPYLPRFSRSPFSGERDRRWIDPLSFLSLFFCSFFMLPWMGEWDNERFRS